MINELDLVALTVPLPEWDLSPGDIGTVVDVLGDRAYIVEFFDDDGETITVEMLEAGQVRLATPEERAALRERRIARQAKAG